MEVLKKASNIIKNKFNSELIYSKKISKSKKKKKQKVVFNVYLYQ